MAAVTKYRDLPVYPHLLASGVEQCKANKANRRNWSEEDNVTSSIKLTKKERLGLARLSWVEKLKRAYPSIEHHLEKRVMQAFMQAVVCYRTGGEFREGCTIDQGLGAHNVTVGRRVIRFDAAHSATIPCLFFRKVGEVERVYLYRSGFYDESNATLDLYKVINQADIKIDGTHSNQRLRTKLVELLNTSSKGEHTPVQTARLFGEELCSQIDRARQTCNGKVGEVLNVYKEVADEILGGMDDPGQFDQWLNLRMDDPLLAEVNGTVAQVAEEGEISDEKVLVVIKKKIEALPPVILEERHRIQNSSRAPNHYYDLFHERVLRQFTGADLTFVETALAMTYRGLKTKIRSHQNCGTTNALLTSHADKIDALAREILPLTAHLRGERVDQATLRGLTEEKANVLRPGVYQLRYAIIGKDQETQSRIKTKVEQIFRRLKATTNGKHFDTFFYHSLLGQAPLGMRKRFSKLFNKSHTALGERVRELKVNQVAHGTLQSNTWLINKLIKEFRGCFRDPTQDNCTQMAERINEIFSRIRSLKPSKSFDTLFYKRLFVRCESLDETALLERLTDRCEADLDATIVEKTDVQTAEAHISANAPRMREIYQVARREIAGLVRATRRFKREMMVELRSAHGMSQERFRAIYEKLYPTYPMSAGTLSHLENGKKEIDNPIIQQVSTIHGVSSMLFKPAHFADVAD